MIALAAAALALSPSFLIQGAFVVDGTGTPGRMADVRVEGERIAAVGTLKQRPGERVVKASGLALTPGFIDAHSHADGGLLRNPRAQNIVWQGITTVIGGQDGGHPAPLSSFRTSLRRTGSSVNVAMFAGHGTLRSAVLGKDFRRAASPAEIERMKVALDAEMKAGALGLSSGLEYDPGLYATTDEVVALAKVAARHGGIYISHVRDEENEALAAFAEAIEIGRRAGLPVQISHIKLGSAPVWGKAREVLAMIEKARASGVSVTADVYPYTFWQSTITVLIPHRNFDDRDAWRLGLAEVGGPANVRLTRYSPDPTWAGKTLAELSAKLDKDPVTLIQEIVKNTQDGKGQESVVVQAMQEADLRAFIRDPRVMFCSDGGIGGSHPRASGSFPRILGRYVRETSLLSLEEAIRKMTSFPARRFGLAKRGLIRPGYFADLVLFNPNTVADRATLDDPAASPVGVHTVWVNGREVLSGDKVGSNLPGRFLTPTQR